MMLTAFVDESYTQDRYYVGAAIADDLQWSTLSSMYRTIRLKTAAEHGLPMDIEFHAHELMGGSGNWKPLRGRHREAAGIYAAALAAAQACGISYLFRGVDVRQLNSRYKYPSPPHQVVLGHLLQRINEYARASSQSEPVRVIADQISSQGSQARELEGYRKLGTTGHQPSALELIERPVRFQPSSTSDGLQAVDLAVYLHRRRNDPAQKNPRAERTLARLCGLVDPMTAHADTWFPERTKTP